MASMNFIWGPVSGVSNSPVFSPPGPQIANDCNSVSRHTLQVFFTGTPSACTYHLYGSAKISPIENPVYPADFQDLTGPMDGTVNPMVHVVNKTVNTLIVVVSALVGATASFRYIGSV